MFHSVMKINLNLGSKFLEHICQEQWCLGQSCFENYLRYFKNYFSSFHHDGQSFLSISCCRDSAPGSSSFTSTLQKGFRDSLIWSLEATFNLASTRGNKTLSEHFLTQIWGCFHHEMHRYKIIFLPAQNHILWTWNSVEYICSDLVSEDEDDLTFFHDHRTDPINSIIES